MLVDTNSHALLEAMGGFGKAYVPDVSVAQCKAYGSCLEGTQLLGRTAEFVVELCTIDGEPACIGCGKGGNGEEAMEAAVGMIVTVDAEVVVVEAEGKEEEEVDGADGADGGVGGAAAPPLPPPPAMVVGSANTNASECKFKCYYTPTSIGTLRINVRVLGQHVLGSPFAIATVEEVPATIILEGQEEGDHQHRLMGVYELMEGKEVNGRGVWEMKGGKKWERFVYYASNKEWWVGNRASMEAGKALGWLKVASTALAPDQVTETWEATPDNKGWVDAPKVRVRI
jgi:hypothetical protein